MYDKDFTCVVCPQGCRITATIDEGKVVAVRGNGCRRGEAYVRTEAVHPMRGISSTVRLRGCMRPVAPVKTACPIPKEKIFAVMAEINALTLAREPIRGDTVIKNAAGTGVDVVAI